MLATTASTVRDRSRRPRRSRLAESEVAEQRRAIRVPQEDVLSFEVPVHDPGAVQRREGVGNARDVVLRDVLCEVRRAVTLASTVSSTGSCGPISRRVCDEVCERAPESCLTKRGCT